ncbi:MAG: hypothetical protein KHX31_00880 [Akkermansia sp.]|nr:hypothetical protein [Akkermansia sp.]
MEGDRPGWNVRLREVLHDCDVANEQFFVILVVPVQGAARGFSEKELTIGLFDGGRNKVVPVTVYQPEKQSSETKTVIFNHGYDGNRNVKSSRTYSCLDRFLAGKGYYVISVQHELPHDPLLAMEGNLMETRMPNRERGVKNILFAIQKFRTLKPGLDWGRLSDRALKRRGHGHVFCGQAPPFGR